MFADFVYNIQLCILFVITNTILTLFQVVDFEGFISTLNEQGYLLKKGNKMYQLQTI